MILRDLLDVWPLAPIAAGVALLVLFGRDPKGADEHNVSDYHEMTEAEARADERGWHRGFDTARRYPRPTTMLRRIDSDISPEPESLDILPPAPAGMDAGSPLYAETLFESWRRETPAVVAARFLREIGDSERAKAGIRPVTSPATDRDYTGSFPVVAVA